MSRNLAELYRVSSRGCGLFAGSSQVLIGRRVAGLSHERLTHNATLQMALVRCGDGGSSFIDYPDFGVGPEVWKVATGARLALRVPSGLAG